MSHYRFRGTIDRGGLVQGLWAVLIFGTVAVAIKSTAANAITIGLVRLAAAAVLVGVLFPAGRQLLQARGRAWWFLGAMGLAFGAHWLTYFLGIKWSNVGLASIGVSSYGVHVMWMSCVLARTRPGRADLASLALLIAGAIATVPQLEAGTGQLPGFLISLFSGWLWATLPLFNQRLAGVPGNARSLAQYLVGLLVFLPFAGEATWKLSATDWAWLAYLAVVATLLAHTLWTHASARLPAGATSVLYYLHLPVALVISNVVLGETYTWPQLGGMALIAAGGLLGLHAMRRPEPPPAD